MERFPKESNHGNIWLRQAAFAQTDIALAENQPRVVQVAMKPTVEQGQNQDMPATTGAHGVDLAVDEFEMFVGLEEAQLVELDELFHGELACGDGGRHVGFPLSSSHFKGRQALAQSPYKSDQLCDYATLQATPQNFILAKLSATKGLVVPSGSRGRCVGSGLLGCNFATG